MGNRTISHVVFVDEIANKLPVNEWFSHIEFAKITTLNYPVTSKARLQKLLKKKQLKTKGGPRNRVWMMTEEMKAAMLAQSEADEAIRREIGKKRHTNNPKIKGKRVLNSVKAEDEARKKIAFQQLSEMRFI